MVIADSIIKQVQIISFDSIPGKTYGNPPFSLNAFSSLGLPVLYRCNSAVIASISDNTITINNAGQATISANQAGNDTVLPANTTRLLVVKKARLIVTADNKTRDYGDPNPQFTNSYSGFVNNENELVLDVKPIAMCTAGPTSPDGQYDIIASNGDDNNYDFTYINGKLAIGTTGIMFKDNSLVVDIYPNPAREKLYFKIPEGLATVQICSLDGKVIVQKEFENEFVTTDISFLSRGFYVIKVMVRSKIFIRKILFL